jgi:hypothetical protein
LSKQGDTIKYFFPSILENSSKTKQEEELKAVEEIKSDENSIDS